MPRSGRPASRSDSNQRPRIAADTCAAGADQRGSAGVCAPAVKDFAMVRNRSAPTTEDAQPRSQTVMTYSEPSPADLESVLEAAPQEFGISHPPLPAAASGSRGAASKCGQRPWLTFPRAQIPLDDLAASRWHASGQGHAWPAQDDFHAAEAVARLQETQRPCRRFGWAGPGPGSLARGTDVRQLQLPPDTAGYREHHGRLPPVIPGGLGRRRRLVPVSALSLHLQLKTGNRFLETNSV
jgi:hypothetical protein